MSSAVPYCTSNMVWPIHVFIDDNSWWFTCKKMGLMCSITQIYFFILLNTNLLTWGGKQCLSLVEAWGIEQSNIAMTIPQSPVTTCCVEWIPQGTHQHLALPQLFDTPTASLATVEAVQKSRVAMPPWAELCSGQNLVRKSSASCRVCGKTAYTVTLLLLAAESYQWCY